MLGTVVLPTNPTGDCVRLMASCSSCRGEGERLNLGLAVLLLSLAEGGLGKR